MAGERAVGLEDLLADGEDVRPGCQAILRVPTDKLERAAADVDDDAREPEDAPAGVANDDPQARRCEDREVGQSRAFTGFAGRGRVRVERQRDGRRGEGEDERPDDRLRGYGLRLWPRTVTFEVPRWTFVQDRLFFSFDSRKNPPLESGGSTITRTL